MIEGMTIAASWLHLPAMVAQAGGYDGQVGGYFSIFKIVVMLVFAVPWLYWSPWVQKDVRLVRAREGVWSFAVVAAGMIGIVVWLLLPFYPVGLLVYLVLTGSAFGAYISHRNARVAPEARVLTSEHLSSLFAKGRKKVEVVTHLRVYNSNGQAMPAPDAATSSPAELNTYNLVQSLLYDMVWRRTIEADLSPAGDRVRVRFVIDGVVVDRPPLGLGESDAVIQYLKLPAGMNVEDRRRPQQGRIAVDLAGTQMDITLKSAGTTGGQRLMFRFVQEVVQTRLNDLGMSQDVLQRVQKMSSEHSGLIIVSGRPGNGVTSTLYSLLRKQDAFVKQIVTLESKPEVDLENITQNTYDDPSKLPGVLASVMRRDPDIIMLDRCRDSETAGLLLEGASSKLVLLGMQANDTFTALAKWAKVCRDSTAAVENLRGVLCQILLRKLCPSCRREYRPDPQVLAKANLPVGKIERFYQPPSGPLMDEKGQPYTCGTCQGSGYHGRTAVFELLEITDEVRQLVASNTSLSQIKGACRKRKMLYLQEQALQRVIEGETSIQEVIRVTKPAKKT